MWEAGNDAVGVSYNRLARKDGVEIRGTKYAAFRKVKIVRKMKERNIVVRGEKLGLSHDGKENWRMIMAKESKMKRRRTYATGPESLVYANISWNLPNM